MKNKTTILITMFINCTICLPISLMANQDTLINRLNSNESKIKITIESLEELKRKVEYQEVLINTQAGMLDTAFDGVSTELSASSNNLTLFGILFGIAGLGLGVYFAYIQLKVSKMQGENKELLIRNTQIKQELEELNSNINNNITKIYSLIRDEETNHIFKRLNEVPEDIDNVFSVLASRNLESKYYSALKSAFLKIHDDFYKSNYLILMYQHFFRQSLEDNEIRAVIMSDLYRCLNGAFRSEVINSTNIFFSYVIKSGIENSVKEINQYIDALSLNNKHVELKEIYSDLDAILENKKTKLYFYSFINKNEGNLKFRKEISRKILSHRYEIEDEEAKLFQEMRELGAI